jgi:hypothetical protein
MYVSSNRFLIFSQHGYINGVESYVPLSPCRNRDFVLFLSFAAARPFALRSLVAFMS